EKDLRHRLADSGEMAASNLDEPPGAAGRISGRTGDEGLEVIGAEKDDDQVQRRMAGEQGRQDAGAIAVGGSGPVVIGRGAAAETFGDHAGLPAQTLFQ